MRLDWDLFFLLVAELFAHSLFNSCQNPSWNQLVEFDRKLFSEGDLKWLALDIGIVNLTNFQTGFCLENDESLLKRFIKNLRNRGNSFAWLPVKRECNPVVLQGSLRTDLFFALGICEVHSKLLKDFGVR